MFTVKSFLSVLTALVFSVGMLYGQDDRIVTAKERNGSTVILVDPLIYVNQIIINNGETVQEKAVRTVNDTIFVNDTIHVIDTLIRVDTLHIKELYKEGKLLSVQRDTVTAVVSQVSDTMHVSDSLLVSDSLQVSDTLQMVSDTLSVTDTLQMVDSIPPIEVCPTRPWLAIKSNILFDCAWMPQYGFCPFPNVAVEYYPDNQYWSYCGSLDIPWWQKPSKHKYFQARNWQLEVRRYFLCERGEYRKLYISGYGHLCVYGIGLKGDRKSWVGEGFGGGVGAGYIWQITPRWRAEAGVQGGILMTKYDPFTYGDPIDHIDNGYYYYDWDGKSEDFLKRQYRYTWIGPTRISLSIVYNLFLRPRQKGDRL